MGDQWHTWQLLILICWWQKNIERQPRSIDIINLVIDILEFIHNSNIDMTKIFSSYGDVGVFIAFLYWNINNRNKNTRKYRKKNKDMINEICQYNIRYFSVLRTDYFHVPKRYISMITGFLFRLPITTVSNRKISWTYEKQFLTQLDTNIELFLLDYLDNLMYVTNMCSICDITKMYFSFRFWFGILVLK